MTIAEELHTKRQEDVRRQCDSCEKQSCAVLSAHRITTTLMHTV